MSRSCLQKSLGHHPGPVVLCKPIQVPFPLPASETRGNIHPFPAPSRWKFPAPGFPRSQAGRLWPCVSCDTECRGHQQCHQQQVSSHVLYLCHEDSTSGHLTDSGVSLRGKVILICGRRAEKTNELSHSLHKPQRTTELTSLSSCRHWPEKPHGS